MMSRIIIHALFIIFLVGQVNAQETATKNRKYKTWIKKTDKTRLIGRLYDVEDTKLGISNSFKAESSQFNYIDVYAYEIEKIKVRRKGQVALGALIGLAAGFTIGAITGFMEGDTPPDPPCQGWGCYNGVIDLVPESADGKALLYGSLYGLLGAGIGAIVGGAIKIKIPINGSESKFRANLPRLKSYAYQK